MYELQKVVENELIHYAITKEENGKIVHIESFDESKYEEAVHLLESLQ